VGVEFVVETSGNVSNLRAVEALGAGCDDEAMRLIRSMKWRPAFKNGQRVRSIMKLDIQFRLNTNQRP
jgi:protein TonB